MSLSAAWLRVSVVVKLRPFSLSELHGTMNPFWENFRVDHSPEWAGGFM